MSAAESSQQSPSAADAIKRQALAAAIAKAQAKRQQADHDAALLNRPLIDSTSNQGSAQPAEPLDAVTEPSVPILDAAAPASDPRKAAIAAAIARAKAKQQQLAGSDPKDQA